MYQAIELTDFLRKSESIPVIDARSEKEFEKAHFPGAFNIPLLNNEERVLVGTAYKQKGRSEAVLAGFDLVGKRFGDLVREALKIAPQKEILTYCWRGGMRSGILSWVLDMAGFKVYVLKGGYKTFRRWAMQVITEPRNVVVLGGMTGSGKTELLQCLAQSGEQVIDLEGLAHHRGSAFGALGQKPQPSNEYFENLIALQWNKTDPAKILWLEDESRNIGYNMLPKSIYEFIRNSQLVAISVPDEWRLERVMKEYASFPPESLIECTLKISQRLGGLRTQQAVEHIRKHEMKEWSKMMLDYYDEMYRYGIGKRAPESIHPLELKSNTYPENVKSVITYGNKIVKQSVVSG